MSAPVDGASNGARLQPQLQQTGSYLSTSAQSTGSRLSSNSLSTTPTQTLRGAPVSSSPSGAWHQRSSMQTRPGDTSRTVSYAPSDTVSGISASEYSSAEDEPVSRGRHLASSSDPRTPKARRRSQAAPSPDDDQRYGPQDDQDDEVQPCDRGEQLVRRRMKERQRVKRQQKQQQERIRQSTHTSGTPLLSPDLHTGSIFLGQRSSSAHFGQRSASRPTTIALPPPGLQPPLASPSAWSAAAHPSPHGHIRRTSSQQPRRNTLRGSYDQRSALTGRSSSSAAGSTHEDDEAPILEDNADHVDDEIDAENEDDEDQDDNEDDDDDDDVEYTLKDRQDAINIEHPFGLPIWKPALYKKSRSVTRNAEIALQSIPSAAAERHYLPGNILWTVLFGSWLSLLCCILSLILKFLPLGGSLYARVLWELAGYLIWPFGKYVEVEVSPDSGDRTSAEYGTTDTAVTENPFTPVAARFPHDHSHVVPFNSRPSSHSSPTRDTGESSGSEPRHSASGSTEVPGNSTSTSPQSSSPKGKGKAHPYGTMYDGERALSDVERIAAEQAVYGYVYSQQGHDVGRKERMAGRIAFAILYALVLFPLMGIVCLTCWGLVFTIPMAKLNWVLLKNLASRPLALHFRSAKRDGDDKAAPLRPGQPAPARQQAGSLQRRSKILLCTYRAVGGQYYKYTVGGVNILFVNTVPLVFFTIIDFFLIAQFVERHGLKSGFLTFVSGQSIIFALALGSVIPLSYFIGMAVASISAQSSIGMGAVINATFGSIIEIILYSIALTQEKARLVEGSLVGSILAGVLLMPGVSMCSGATRRKEQRFNARSAGVTSTMLIMAIIGILTPTLFYQIYGTFQLTCEGCPADASAGDSWSCHRCFYEHVPPATDPFFQQNVRGLMYTCTVILVLSYGVGLWFSLRTHASQIWQNALPPISTQPAVTHVPSAQRASVYKRLVPAAAAHLLPTASTPNTAADQMAPLKLPEAFSHEDYHRAMTSALHTAYQQGGNQALADRSLRRQSKHEEEEGGAAEGGHDAPSWSRATSLTVLISCTVLYAVIAEILVSVVDVVLEGSGIDEKFLGVTLFALVPNTTEFMNAMSFAINGNIALSMEIGSAYALQVCLIQIPAMVVFSAYYNSGLSDDSLILRSFTLIFPRWDVIAIIFSVFLLTYTYIESRSNYYRGTICILSYMVLVAGFYFAPATGDTEAPGDDNRLMSFGAAGESTNGFTINALSALLAKPMTLPHLGLAQWVLARWASLWTR